MNVKCTLEVLYCSTGIGQVVGLIGITVSLITALVQKIIASIHSACGNPYSAAWISDSIDLSLQWAKIFALGMIPVVGGRYAFEALF